MTMDEDEFDSKALMIKANVGEYPTEAFEMGFKLGFRQGYTASLKEYDE